jgi:hypothetical protein
VKVPPEIVSALKTRTAPYNLKDVREANIRKINGKFKIVDAIAK